MELELVSAHAAEVAEYILAVGCLLAFIPFWRYARSRRVAEVIVGVRVVDPPPLARSTRRPVDGPAAPAGSDLAEVSPSSSDA